MDGFSVVAAVELASRDGNGICSSEPGDHSEEYRKDVRGKVRKRGCTEVEDGGWGLLKLA